MQLAAFIVVPFGLGYFISYFLRNINAVLSPAIVSEFSLTATQIGFLTSLYFFAAALVVVPNAMFLDRYGPRKVLIVQTLVTAIGCLIFARAETLGWLMVGRALSGLGIAGCLMTAFKAITVWLPRKSWATGNSLVLGVGSLGVIAGTQPLQWLLEWVSWRDVFWLVAVVCIVLCAWVAWFTPESKTPGTAAATGSSSAIYIQVFQTPLFWRLIPIASLSMAMFFSIQGLWANAWMSDVALLDQQAIGSNLLVMALAMSAGMLINGTLSDLLTGFGIPLAAVLLLGVFGMLVALLTLSCVWAPAAWWPWALLGYTGNIGALGYPLLSRSFPVNVSARVMSVLAACNFLFAFVLQFTLGMLLDRWPRTQTGAYPPEAYQTALLLCATLLVLTIFWFSSSREVWRSTVNA
ncbi:MAG: MFS transporter [Granulosicoccus sp.]|nr:MFS transporter [Granulosicoccus sp.]